MLTGRIKRLGKKEASFIAIVTYEGLQLYREDPSIIDYKKYISRKADIVIPLYNSIVTMPHRDIALKNSISIVGPKDTFTFDTLSESAFNRWYIFLKNYRDFVTLNIESIINAIQIPAFIVSQKSRVIIQNKSAEAIIGHLINTKLTDRITPSVIFQNACEHEVNCKTENGKCYIATLNISSLNENTFLTTIQMKYEALSPRLQTLVARIKDLENEIETAHRGRSRTNTTDLELILSEEIGHGQNGKVYLGIVSGKKVAVKVFSGPVKTEARILKKLKNPNIIKYHSRDVFEGHARLITEYCNRGNLDQLVACKKLSAMQIRCLIYQILKGISYIHSQGFVHRDIKPSNILLTSKGLVKIADFGLAKMLKNNSTNTLTGTPHYMSPEVLRPTGYGKGIDIWSLGITIIDIVEPHSKKITDAQEKIFSISRGDPVVYDKKLYDSNLSNFLQLCLTEDQTKRPDAESLLKHAYFQSITDNNVQMEIRKIWL